MPGAAPEILQHWVLGRSEPLKELGKAPPPVWPVAYISALLTDGEWKVELLQRRGSQFLLVSVAGCETAEMERWKNASSHILILFSLSPAVVTPTVPPPPHTISVIITFLPLSET